MEAIRFFFSRVGIGLALFVLIAGIIAIVSIIANYAPLLLLGLLVLFCLFVLGAMIKDDL